MKTKILPTFLFKVMANTCHQLKVLVQTADPTHKHGFKSHFRAFLFNMQVFKCPSQVKITPMHICSECMLMTRQCDWGTFPAVWEILTPIYYSFRTLFTLGIEPKLVPSLLCYRPQHLREIVGKVILLTVMQFQKWDWTEP